MFRLHERSVAYGAVLAIRTEVLGAIVIGHHASLLACLVLTIGHDVLTLFEAARIDVDVTVGHEYCLRLHVCVLDENLILQVLIVCLSHFLN